MSLCRRPDIADELVQTTAERAVANRGKHDPATALLPWLMRILRNAWIDQTRRATTRGTELDVTEMPETAIFNSNRALEASLRWRETEAAMATLTRDQQEILRLVCIEELSYAEAAEVLEIPKGTVMSRLARARVALAEKLGIT
jgi:RNA polymerase sigma-70 factor (ECF subfamily)